jgi:hypothetical protein
MLGVSTVLELAFTVVLAQCLYYRYLHPLSHYPGPFLASFSDLWYAISHTLYLSVSDISIGSFSSSLVGSTTSLNRSFMRNTVMSSVRALTAYHSQAWQTSTQFTGLISPSRKAIFITSAVSNAKLKISSVPVQMPPTVSVAGKLSVLLFQLLKLLAMNPSSLRMSLCLSPASKTS